MGSPRGSPAAGFQLLPAQLCFVFFFLDITLFSLGLVELVVLYTQDVFAGAVCPAGARRCRSYGRAACSPVQGHFSIPPGTAEKRAQLLCAHRHSVF